MSARPGPSGGYHVSGIPTGISLPHFQKRRHSWEERESHMRRRERIQQIKTELEALLGRRADLE